MINEFLRREIATWQIETFNNGVKTPKQALPMAHHLDEEVKELIDELEIYLSKPQTPQSIDKIGKEVADGFILMLGIASALGMTMVDVELAIKDKMKINKSREWGQPGENGVVNHIS